MECQIKLQTFSRDLNATKLQIAQKERERRINDLVQQELAGLGNGKKTYKSVGKMFLFADSADISKDLKKESKVTVKEAEALGKKKEYIERSMLASLLGMTVEDAAGIYQVLSSLSTRVEVEGFLWDLFGGPGGATPAARAFVEQYVSKIGGSPNIANSMGPGAGSKGTGTNGNRRHMPNSNHRDAEPALESEKSTFQSWQATLSVPDNVRVVNRRLEDEDTYYVPAKKEGKGGGGAGASSTSPPAHAHQTQKTESVWSRAALPSDPKTQKSQQVWNTPAKGQHPVHEPPAAEPRTTVQTAPPQPASLAPQRSTQTPPETRSGPTSIRLTGSPVPNQPKSKKEKHQGASDKKRTPMKFSDLDSLDQDTPVGGDGKMLKDRRERLMCECLVIDPQQQLRLMQQRQQARSAERQEREVRKSGDGFMGRRYAGKAGGAPKMGDLKLFPGLAPIPVDNEETLAKALSQRDRLLDYDKTSAARTRVHDAASDFDYGNEMSNRWATREEREAAARKEADRRRREEEAKRTVRVDFDFVGGRVVGSTEPLEENSKTRVVSAPAAPAADADKTSGSTGTFASNPYLHTPPPTYISPSLKVSNQAPSKKLPVWKSSEDAGGAVLHKGGAEEGASSRPNERKVSKVRMKGNRLQLDEWDDLFSVAGGEPVCGIEDGEE
ncbi:hypothetical protein HDU93_008353 [Gonapodya sp. JEL0774]|nr:hypothetical protein HDU93_008353 [Gonapodya sp. JEL0774]